MPRLNIYELKKIDYKKIGGDIERLVRQENHLLDSSYTDTISIGFIGLLMREKKYDVYNFTIEIEDETLKYHLQMIFKRYRSLIENIINKYSAEELKSITLFYSEESKISEKSQIPDDLLKLIYSILDIKESEIIADLKSRYGNFLVNSHMIQENARYIGYDSDIISNTISKMKLYLLGLTQTIEQKDIVKIESDFKFDKIFAFPPIGVRVRSDLKDVENIYPEEVKRVLNLEWIFALKASGLLKDDGKAIILMTQAALFNNIDTEIRKYMIENGLIESITKLTGRLFSWTGVGISIVVLSKNNKKIKLVDASNDFVENRYKNILEDKNIEDILLKLENSKESIDMEIKEFNKHRYQLDPSIYLDVLESKNAVKLEELIKSINRGSNLSKKQLEDITVDYETNIKFMNLKDIDNGNILNTVSYIEKELSEDKKIFKDSLKNGDLILSRVGSPLKIAIVEDIQEKEIYYTGNLYSIRVDKDKVNPYYIKAFFESSEGQKALNSISQGTAIPMISLSNLNDLKIPYIALEKQEKFVNNYIDRNNEINNRKIEIEEMEEQLRENTENFFKEVIECS